MRGAATALLLAVVLGACGAADGGAARPRGGAGDVAFPATPTARRAAVAVVGDMGTGEAAQYEVAEAMCRTHDDTHFDTVVTTGDNVYQSGHPRDFEAKFLDPYECLLERSVDFRASFGNHDIATAGGAAMLADDRFGMDGRYYSFVEGPTSFVVLDSNALDDGQLAWLDRTLAAVRSSPWTIVVFHHPPHSGGTKHGSDHSVRGLLAPRLEDGGVDLVLSGHEHLYSRAEAGGITYVVAGGGGAELSSCAPNPPPETRACASAHHFVLIDMTPSSLRLRATTPDGRLVDDVRLAPRP